MKVKTPPDLTSGQFLAMVALIRLRAESGSLGR